MIADPLPDPAPLPSLPVEAAPTLDPLERACVLALLGVLALRGLREGAE